MLPNPTHCSLGSPPVILACLFTKGERAVVEWAAFLVTVSFSGFRSWLPGLSSPCLLFSVP